MHHANEKNQSKFNLLTPSLQSPGEGLLYTYDKHDGRVYEIVYHKESDKIISASHDNSIHIWDIKYPDKVQTVNFHSAPVISVAVADSPLAISASSDDVIIIWDLMEKEIINTINEYSKVHTVRITNDGKKAVVSLMDFTIRVWDIDLGKELISLQGHNGRVNDFVLLHKNPELLSCSDDGTLYTALNKWKSFLAVVMRFSIDYLSDGHANRKKSGYWS